MKIKKPASAGTLESSDVFVSVAPNEGGGIDIELESEVEALFGDAMEAAVRRELALAGITEAAVRLQDHGALDCVIAARVRCALYRAAEERSDWTREDGGQ